MYLIKTPFWMRLLYPSCTWRMPSIEKVLYLTFDDGPHAEMTPFVLEQLAIYNAKASFFCIGKNVQTHPHIYASLIAAGHTVGNHTQNHMNGWQHTTSAYLAEIEEASLSIASNLFRPPYGRISFAQINAIKNRTALPQNIVMWDILSGDFDTTISGAACAANVIQHARPGSIVVFHDSAKAMDRLHIALPKVLAHFSTLGYHFRAL